MVWPRIGQGGRGGSKKYFLKKPVIHEIGRTSKDREGAHLKTKKLKCIYYIIWIRLDTFKIILSVHQCFNYFENIIDLLVLINNYNK